jgi:hypothetical protein
MRISWLTCPSNHVDHDLEPYVCLSERCRNPIQFFATSREWMDHMQRMHTLDWAWNVHTTVWRCDLNHAQVSEKVDRSEFDDKDGLVQHLSSSHGEDLSRLEIITRARRGRTIRTRESFTCPFCDCQPDEIARHLSERPYNLLFEHIASHLKALAFFSLSYLDSIENCSESSGSRKPSAHDDAATRSDRSDSFFDDIPLTVVRGNEKIVQGQSFVEPEELDEPVVWPTEVVQGDSGPDETLERFAAAALEISESSLSLLLEARAEAGAEESDEDFTGFSTPSHKSLPSKPGAASSGDGREREGSSKRRKQSVQANPLLSFLFTVNELVYDYEVDSVDKYHHRVPPTYPLNYTYEIPSMVMRYADGKVSRHSGQWYRGIASSGVREQGSIFQQEPNSESEWSVATVYSQCAVFACNPLLPIMVCPHDPYSTDTRSCWEMLSILHPSAYPGLSQVVHEDSRMPMGPGLKRYVAGTRPDWMPSLIPTSYQIPSFCDFPRSAGLGGELSIILGLMALTVESDSTGTNENINRLFLGDGDRPAEWRNRRWYSTRRPRGRKLTLFTVNLIKFG